VECGPYRWGQLRERAGVRMGGDTVTPGGHPEDFDDLYFSKQRKLKIGLLI